MIIKMTLTPSDLNKSIDFEDATLEDFKFDLTYERHLTHTVDVIEFVNDKGDLIKVFKNRFGETKSK